MKLYCSLTSPFARKIRVALREWGLAQRCEVIVVDPWSTPPALLAVNPLCKIPALETDDGIVLIDSQLILEYLETVSHRRPVGLDAAHWRAATRAQLADGLIDAAVAAFVETKRPPQLQSEDWKGRQRAAIGRTLDVLEAEIADFALDADIGIAELTLGCALAYIDFRLPDMIWREGRPGLSNWIAVFSQRSSMQETRPPT